MIRHARRGIRWHDRPTITAGPQDRHTIAGGTIGMEG